MRLDSHFVFYCTRLVACVVAPQDSMTTQAQLGMAEKEKQWLELLGDKEARKFMIQRMTMWQAQVCLGWLRRPHRMEVVPAMACGWWCRCSSLSLRHYHHPFGVQARLLHLFQPPTTVIGPISLPGQLLTGSASSPGQPLTGSTSLPGQPGSLLPGARK